MPEAIFELFIESMFEKFTADIRSHMGSIAYFAPAQKSYIKLPGMIRGVQWVINALLIYGHKKMSSELNLLEQHFIQQKTILCSAKARPVFWHVNQAVYTVVNFVLRNMLSVYTWSNVFFGLEIFFIHNWQIECAREMTNHEAIFFRQKSVWRQWSRLKIVLLSGTNRCQILDWYFLSLFFNSSVDYGWLLFVKIDSQIFVINHPMEWVFPQPVNIPSNVT